TNNGKGTIPIVLLGNKSDLRDENSIPIAVIKKYVEKLSEQTKKHGFNIYYAEGSTKNNLRTTNIFPQVKTDIFNYLGSVYFNYLEKQRKRDGGSRRTSLKGDIDVNYDKYFREIEDKEIEILGVRIKEEKTETKLLLENQAKKEQEKYFKKKKIGVIKETGIKSDKYQVDDLTKIKVRTKNGRGKDSALLASLSSVVDSINKFSKINTIKNNLKNILSKRLTQTELSEFINSTDDLLRRLQIADLISIRERGKSIVLSKTAKWDKEKAFQKLKS
ncbi:MAG: hypothetical protein HeimC3_21880, partial [Candidatus Heimdallarchaeota archaeon LC_3]